MSRDYSDFIPGVSYPKARAYLTDPEFIAARRALFGEAWEIPHEPTEHLKAMAQIRRPSSGWHAHETQRRAAAGFADAAKEVAITREELARSVDRVRAKQQGHATTTDPRSKALWQEHGKEARANGISRETFLNRVYSGWDVAKAINVPKRTRIQSR